MRNFLDWLTGPMTVNRATWFFVFGIFWFMILKAGYDYLTYTRPLQQCVKAEQRVCPIGNAVAYIGYRRKETDQ